MKRIIVIFGGASPEHDVSIITGVLCLNGLDKTKFIPVPLYVTKTGEWFTGEKLSKLGFYKAFDKRKLKRVFLVPGENVLKSYKSNKTLFTVHGAINCMHGGMGENGTIAGLFELCNIPCATTDAFSARIAMDKLLTKTASRLLGVNVVDYLAVKRADFYGDYEKVYKAVQSELGFPVIVKPNGTGSSIGITVAKSKVELFRSLTVALKYDEKAVVEKYIANFTEVNCAAYYKDGTVLVSELEKPLSEHDILTFVDKYSGGKGDAKKREFPAKVSKKISDEVKAVTKKFYTAYEFSSIIRADYIIDGETVYLNEINSVPGSLAYYLFYDTVSGLTDLLTDLLKEARRLNVIKNSKETDYSSDILSFKGVALKK